MIHRRPTLLERIYAHALRLFPAPFRHAYEGPMRQALSDALSDPAIPRRRLLPLLAKDLFTSLTREHTTMLRDTYARPALLFNALILAGIATVLALALYAIPQQVLRNGANDPQIQLAIDLTARLEAGETPAQAAPAGNIDIARSLSPFVLVYDSAGTPVAGNAHLQAQIPAPPTGVFDFVRQHGEERVSWQPAPGVFIAAVIERLQGPHPGFVLAGRSLREEEARQKHVGQMAGLAWIAMLAMIAAGTALAGWMTRKPPVLQTA